MAQVVSLRFKVRHEKEVKKMLSAMERRSKNFRPVFKKAQKMLEEANAENFAQAGLPSGGWKPLDAQYGSWKATRFPGVPTMVRSGRLFRSVTNLSNPARIIDKTTAEFGTPIEYAKFHQYGTRKMPKRQVIFEPPSFARDLGREAADHVANG